MRLAFSVVVPTYNRGMALRDTIQSLIDCDISGFGGGVEIIIADDGSLEPAEAVRGVLRMSTGRTLQFIRQSNGGPASARNSGIKSSRGDAVLCVDDDIVVPRGLLLQYFEAMKELPGSVIFGRSPFEEGPDNAALRRFLLMSALDCGRSEQKKFTRESTSIASGHILFPRGVIDRLGTVYLSRLRTPGAEEIELACRLNELGIPFYSAEHISATHRQPVSLGIICNQHYKHGMGCGEAQACCDHALSNPALIRFACANAPARWGEPFSMWGIKAMKAVLVPFRAWILGGAELVAGILPMQRLLDRVFRTVIGLYFFAGYREGLRRFLRVENRVES